MGHGVVEPMITFDVLASSSAGNCAVLTDGETKLLLECGIRFADIRREVGFSLSSFGGCLVTHEHGDHAAAVSALMKAGVDVFASAGTFDALGIRGHRARLIKAGVRFQIGTWRCVGFGVPHDAAEPLGYLLASGANRVLYLIDCAYSPFRFNGLTHVMLGVNYSAALLRESSVAPEHKRRVLRSHMSLERAIDLLAANDLTDVREIWLLHLSDGHSDEAAFKQAVERATGKPTFVAPARAAAAGVR